jgi:hypothetical protein
MPRPKAGSELDSLLRQQAELNKKIKEAEARERAKRKQDDERRRLLAGTVALDHSKAKPDSPFATTLLSLLSDRLKSAEDRALFDLPAPPSASGQHPVTASRPESGPTVLPEAPSMTDHVNGANRKEA